jgi:hypothetical protein
VNVVGYDRCDGTIDVSGHCEHHGLGVFGQLVAPQTNGTASPSAIRIDPTSLPFDRSVPQSLFQLHANVPCVPSGHEQRTYSNSSPPARTSSRSRRVARALSSASAGQLALRGSQGH